MKIGLLWAATIIMSITGVFLLLTKGVYCAKEGELVPDGMIINGCCRNMNTIKNLRGNSYEKRYSIGNTCYKESSIYVEAPGFYRENWSIKKYIERWKYYNIYFTSKIRGKEAPNKRAICSYCGNGTCDNYEDACNCSQDCKNGENSQYTSVKDFCEKIKLPENGLQSCDESNKFTFYNKPVYCSLCGNIK